MSLFSFNQSPDVSRVSPEQRIVRLSGHSTIDLSEVEYVKSANRFFYGGLDVTSLLTTPQRLAFPSYASAGIVQTNEDNYIAKTGDTSSGGSTSTLGNYVSGIGNDISGIAYGIRNFVAGDPSQPSAMSDLKKLVIVGIIGGLLFLTWKVVTAFKSR